MSDYQSQTPVHSTRFSPSFITTPIFYANGDPHLGHAYTGVVADILHRFANLSGSSSVLVTGTDEHGQKIANTASERGQTPKSFVDSRSDTFRALWPQLGFEPDVFIRTTDEVHKRSVEKVWQTLEEKGDIYLGHYSGDYCVACEQFYSEHELLQNRFCPIHKQATNRVEEPTFLFQLEKYRLALLEYYQSNPNVIVPRHFQNTIIEQLSTAPLADLSISRVNNQWGIKVPGNPEHTVYVWLDALFSYITAIEQQGGKQSQIGETQHVIGKDILLFHAVYWPIFLLALDLPLPKRLIVHGWWTINGEKISKSNPETTVNPKVFSEKLTADGFRYSLVRQKPLYRDGNVDLEDFSATINSDLLNSFANLVKRNHTLIVKTFGGQLSLDEVGALDEESRSCLASSSTNLNSILKDYHAGDIYRVTKVINAVLAELNAFFHHREPWLVRKGQSENKARQTCLVVANIVRELAWLLSPITPELCKRVIAELENQPSTVFSNRGSVLCDLRVKSANSHWQRINGR